jgi:NAD(P)-dependent dehydrogenase (short-subunit alcohol dehydrogenase family)
MRRDKSWTWSLPATVEAANPDLEGTRVAIIGGTGGIGRALSRHMASRGARVLSVGQTFRDADVAGIEFMKADLSLMQAARRVARSLPAETLDLVMFTNGIFAAPKREESAEGIERDLAVSYLSRWVILREIAPRLGARREMAWPKKPRVFIMGYPGAGQAGNPDDLNAEKCYRVMTAHMNTVAGNEMLVLNAAKRYANANFFGLNPGLIKTNIRANLMGENSLKHRFTEWMIGVLAPSADLYAKRLTPLLFAPELETRSGALFDRKCRPILPSPKLTESHVNRFMAASEALASRALRG